MQNAENLTGRDVLTPDLAQGGPAVVWMGYLVVHGWDTVGWMGYFFEKNLPLGRFLSMISLVYLHKRACIRFSW